MTYSSHLYVYIHKRIHTHTYIGTCVRIHSTSTDYGSVIHIDMAICICMFQKIATHDLTLSWPAIPMDMQHCRKRVFQINYSSYTHKTKYKNVPNKLRNNVIQLDLANRKPQDHNGTIKYKKTFYAIINQLFLVISSSAFVCTI